MTYLILMVVLAAAMVLFREPLGRELVKLVEAAPWKRLATLAVVLLLAWVSLQTFHVGFVAPLTGDTAATLFDMAAVYADLLIAMAVAVLNRQTRQLASRLIDLARPGVRRLMRRAGRAPRPRIGRRRRPPNRDEPEPAAGGGLPAFA